MSQFPTFSLYISKDLPTDEQERLLLVMRTNAEVQESTNRTLGVEWIAIVVSVAQDVGTVAGAAAALMKLANEIKTWRKNARKRGVEPKAELQHPEKTPLDLSNATDEEIDEWLLR